MTAKAVAYSNNDVSFLAWRYDAKIPQCLGFAVFRTDLAGGAPEPLPAWVGFADQPNANWKPRTTREWPIQKFSWRDLTAKAGHSYQYKVVPMVGTENKLKPLDDQALTTNAVTLLPKQGSFSVYFNRGILSTQSLARQLPSGPNSSQRYEKLADHIDNLTDPPAAELGGSVARSPADAVKTRR